MLTQSVQYLCSRKYLILPNECHGTGWIGFFPSECSLMKEIRNLKNQKAENLVWFEWINDTCEIQEHNKSSTESSIWTLCENLSTKKFYVYTAWTWLSWKININSKGKDFLYIFTKNWSQEFVVLIFKVSLIFFNLWFMT